MNSKATKSSLDLQQAGRELARAPGGVKPKPSEAVSVDMSGGKPTNDALRGSRLTKKAQKREHILTCAQGVFATRGVVDATMQDIATAAGVSKGALYLLFSSKDELYLQLATAAAEGLIVRLRQAAAQPNGFEQARALLKSYAQYYLENATRFRLAIAWLAPGFHLDDAIPITSAYRETIVEVMRISVAAFESGQRDGSIRPELDGPRTVLQLWGGVVGLLLVRTKAADTGPLPPQVNSALWSGLASKDGHAANLELDHLVDEFIELVMSAVRAPQPTDAT